MEKLKRGQGKVLLAVNFDDSGKRLIKVAAELCRKAQMSLRLTHVVEPIFPSYMALGHSIAGMSPDVFQSIQDEAAHAAEQKLKELASEYKDLKVEVSVPAGLVGAALLDEVKQSGANLVLVGAAKGSHSLMLRGFSTAMSLMHDAPAPVLIIPGDAAFDLGTKDFRIVIADDLREETHTAVETGFDFATMVSAHEVLELHASSMTEELFKTTMKTALVAARASDEVATQELWNFTQKMMQEKLEARALPEKKAYRTAGGRYKALCEVGKVQDEILRHVASYKPHLVVFGRHQRFHGKSLAYGQLPFHLMLALERPILVVPNQNH